MRQLFRLFVLFVIVVCLSGCPWNVVVKTEYVVIAPPDSLLVACEATPPPNPFLFKQLTSYIEREELITDYTLDQVSDLSICNNKLTLLTEWKKEKIKLWSQKNATIRNDPPSEGEKEAK